MPRDDAVRLWEQAEPELRARGVTSLALFGSTARGKATQDSDVAGNCRFRKCAAP
ncbi:MAG: nucleotidyltransferase domain-containing protein [Proteobacteria bacterium]|nr:nucleotidyltransferase domain-containing protein [Pseudomonadota bacterium]